MKGIKISGLTQKLSQVISNLRVKEVKSAKKLRLLNVYGATLGMFGQKLRCFWRQESLLVGKANTA